MNTTKLYYDCCHFWKNQGVEKEENIIALALSDLVFCKKNVGPEWESHYKAIAEKAIKEIKDPKYDAHRGEEGFLINSGL